LPATRSHDDGRADDDGDWSVVAFRPSLMQPMRMGSPAASSTGAETRGSVVAAPRRLVGRGGVASQQLVLLVFGSIDFNEGGHGHPRALSDR
jgi:hypothetical protein